ARSFGTVSRLPRSGGIGEPGPGCPPRGIQPANSGPTRAAGEPAAFRDEGETMGYGAHGGSSRRTAAAIMEREMTDTHRPGGGSVYSLPFDINEIGRRGEDLYERELRDRLEPEHIGKFVV